VADNAIRPASSTIPAPLRIRIRDAACLSQRCHVVNVDSQSGHISSTYLESGKSKVARGKIRQNTSLPFALAPAAFSFRPPGFRKRKVECARGLEGIDQNDMHLFPHSAFYFRRSGFPMCFFSSSPISRPLVKFLFVLAFDHDAQQRLGP